MNLKTILRKRTGFHHANKISMAIICGILTFFIINVQIKDSRSHLESKPIFVELKNRNPTASSGKEENPLPEKKIETKPIEAPRNITSLPKIINKTKPAKNNDDAKKKIVGMTVDLLDNVVKTNGNDKVKEQYAYVKSVLALYNKEASSWAHKVSKSYKKEVEDNPVKINWSYKNEFKNDEITSHIEMCGCDRTVRTNLQSLENRKINDSTCSLHSLDRGIGQRVIGFSFYGDPNSKIGKSRKYFQGIKENLELVPKYYPGWNIRLYYDLEENHPLMKDLCDMACHDSNIDLCYIKQIPGAGDLSKIFAMNWRFLPMLDAQVDHLVSRDLDSRLNHREAAAVKEWLTKSDKAFHFMRDHPAHSIEILGSGWGVRMGEREKKYAKDAFEMGSKEKMFWAPRKSYGPDQGFLKRYIWPWGKWNAMSHDSYTCVYFPRTSPFPVERKFAENNFVAAVVESKDFLKQECPYKCRPKDHKDWKYC